MGPTSIGMRNLELNRMYVMSEYEVRISEYSVTDMHSANPAYDDRVLSVVDLVYEVMNIPADPGKCNESR
jgi:hypothetical protein